MLNPDEEKPVPWNRPLEALDPLELAPREEPVPCEQPSSLSLVNGLSLRWSVSADMALSEKSPYLGSAWVR